MKTELEIFNGLSSVMAHSLTNTCAPQPMVILLRNGEGILPFEMMLELAELMLHDEAGFQKTMTNLDILSQPEAIACIWCIKKGSEVSTAVIQIEIDETIVVYTSEFDCESKSFKPWRRFGEGEDIPGVKPIKFIQHRQKKELETVSIKIDEGEA